MRTFTIPASMLALIAGTALACPPEDCTRSGVQVELIGAEVDFAPFEGVAASSAVIDLAICLDTSGSMDGLIESAKQKLWAIVNDLATAQPAPQLRVALITFGNDGHNQEDGWTFVQTGFTDDLDTVSARLFELRTNGGTELVGRALHTASTLDWHPSEGALRIVVVAGNESADQDAERNYRDVCRGLIERDVIVNAIYCGDKNDEIAPGWHDVALRADGQFATIDQNGGTVVIETPFDAPLAQLSADLNTTYIPFGAHGAAGCSNQWAQDANAESLNVTTAAARAVTKSSCNYTNVAWDLVDASRQESFKLADVKDEDLPENMRGMSLDQRVAHIAEMSARRAEIGTKIAGLNTQREAFVADELRRRGLDETNAFDAAIRRAIRDQARAKGIRFADDDAAAVVIPAAEAVGPPTPEVVPAGDGSGC